MPAIPLAEGEYIIWSSRRSPMNKLTPRQLLGLFIVGFYLFSTIVVLSFVGGPLVFLAFVAAAVAIVLFVRWSRRRESFFMTNQHLIDAGILSKKKIPLMAIQACERHVHEVYTRYGTERVITDKVALLAGGHTFLVGPVLDFDGLWELIHHGVLKKTIQLSALPALDGGPAPAEKRTDIVLLLTTKTDGDEYGPLFVGPTKIIRFTEKLPSILERILLTVAAGENTADEMEHHMQQLLRHPQAGHAVILKRDLTAASVEGSTLTLTGHDQTLKMELRAGDVTRVGAFVRQWRPAHPMR